MRGEYDLFKSGSTWVRADFHLHTDADQEFNYSGEKNSYIKDYVNQLVDQDIRIACITNHNKFDYSEYKALAKAARKKEIYILPGVELSVNDGANGIHACIIFDPIQWLSNENDFINQFLNQSFAGKHNYENENGRSKHSLLETISILEDFNCSYFIIMAHVEAPSGFCKELKGGRIEEMGDNPMFRKAVLGFQKVRTWDEVEKWKKWLGDDLPAFVEGSDAKNIEEIGTGNVVNGETQKTYLKIGDYNFDAIRFALLDKENRIAQNIPRVNNSYIHSVAFEGGKLDGETIFFNHAMNNLIGIRGSGKSSILEAIRYAIDIQLDEQYHEDVPYKEKLVQYILGSGGKMVTTLIHEHGYEYRLEKIYGDLTSIYKDDEYKPSLKPDAILKKPIYYGQKDLSKIGSDLSTEKLIEQLTGSRLKDIRHEIQNKIQAIVSTVNTIQKTENKIHKKPDTLARKADLQEKINIFKEYKLDQKLKDQVNYDKDENYIRRLNTFQKEILNALDELISEYESQFQMYFNYQAKSGNEKVPAIQNHLQEFEKIFLKLKDVSQEMKKANLLFSELKDEFISEYNKLKDAFSEIKRNVKIPNVQADDYIKFTKELDLVKARLEEYEKLVQAIMQERNRLDLLLQELENLWHKEYMFILEEVKKVNDDQSSIEIKVDFRGNKNHFKSYLKDNLRGSNMRDNQIQQIVDHYNDLIQVFKDLKNEKNKLKNLLSDTGYVTFKQYFEENLESFLTYRVPDKFDIIYNGRSISEHSLGQRSSALIIFLLTLKESDIIIIDQPEDDLDSQTIYKDVIKVLKELKNDTQFIFATHNPNIPVLGDSEQVIVCHYEKDKIRKETGSIDKTNIQDAIIDIMEGGKEAFDNRKQIYELWKP